jgi:hypothetical protein
MKVGVGSECEKRRDQSLLKTRPAAGPLPVRLPLEVWTNPVAVLLVAWVRLQILPRWRLESDQKRYIRDNDEKSLILKSQEGPARCGLRYSKIR